jgi:putative radical SAM enzyme (TIGR03279 family)
MVRVITSKDKRIPTGTRLIAINDQKVKDLLEFEFYNDTSKTRQVTIQTNSTSRRITYKPHETIAVSLAPPKYRQCANDCDFCFINGLPRHLRKELYFRDDDYRLSFLFGNFLSLTNVSKSDISRIGRLRLSPLYISVHTTDPEIRTRLFKNKRAGQILEQLKALADNDIKLHCQIVVIPGVTSGKNLSNTIKDLSSLYPAVTSIGIVPVGKTKYAMKLPSVSRKLAQSIVRTGMRFHNLFRKKHKRGLVYLADEFFIKTGYKIPEKRYYDDFPQYENGIGMVRSLLDEINAITRVKRTKGRHLILTGKLAYPYLKFLKVKIAPNMHVDIKSVPNVFFGKTVTVSGLLSAQDLNRTITRVDKHYDTIIVPPNCVNDSHQFLDDRKAESKSVLISPKTIQELLRCLQ